MLDNHVYNLLLQLTQENKSLWRIKNEYIKDSGECADCQAFWKRMEKDKDDHIKELTELVKRHL